MLKRNLHIEIVRQLESWDYKQISGVNSYKNNVKHNAIDTISLFLGHNKIWSYDRLQTVSNHPLFKYQDTVKDGDFQIKCFQDKRNFDDDFVHGIINAEDIEGQLINEFSMQYDNGEHKGRWLLHSARWQGVDTKHAYSGACFVFLEYNKFREFNNQLIKLKVKKDDLINCKLIQGG